MTLVRHMQVCGRPHTFAQRKVMVNGKAFDGKESEMEPRNVIIQLPGMDPGPAVRPGKFS